MGMIAFYAGLILGALGAIVGLSLFAMTFRRGESGELCGCDRPDGFAQAPRNQSGS
jgi:hypothetical protein